MRMDGEQGVLAAITNSTRSSITMEQWLNFTRGEGVSSVGVHTSSLLVRKKKTCYPSETPD